ncbi:MAG: hypothetical protein LBG88_04010 [Christensenellaceae bacterium]|nr:hypothetical protein [Christensenellaceae bacterium]
MKKVTLKDFLITALGIATVTLGIKLYDQTQRLNVAEHAAGKEKVHAFNHLHEMIKGKDKQIAELEVQKNAHYESHQDTARNHDTSIKRNDALSRILRETLVQHAVRNGYSPSKAQVEVDIIMLGVNGRVESFVGGQGSNQAYSEFAGDLLSAFASTETLKNAGWSVIEETEGAEPGLRDVRYISQEINFASFKGDHAKAERIAGAHRTKSFNRLIEQIDPKDKRRNLLRKMGQEKDFDM